MRRDVVGVVLAGGRSRRMGRDKALLEVDGSALVERAANLLSEVCTQTVLAVGQGRRYPALSLTQVEDQRPDSGPLAGLEAALSWASPRAVLVLACDLPQVNAAVLERVLREAGSPKVGPAAVKLRASAWLAARGGRLQPLCGLYSAACRAVFAGLLDRGERAVLHAIAAIDSQAVDFDDLDSDPFLNVNTPADYVRAGGQAVTP